MAIYDNALVLSPLGSFDIGLATNYMVTDLVDLGQQRTMAGGDLYMVFRVTEAIGTITGTPRFQLWAIMADTADLASNFVVIGSTQMWGASLLGAGVPQFDQKIYIRLPHVDPDPLNEAAGIGSSRFIGAMFYNGTEAAATNFYGTGSFHVSIVQAVQSWRAYPSGYSVA